MNDIDRFSQVGIEAARDAGKFLRSRFQTGFTVSRKGAIDLVTEVDLAAEEMIVSRLTREFPGHAILAEETCSDSRPGAVTWIVDPLDGTTNYAHGFPVFCVSIGLEIGGELEWGAVYNPNLEELFTARRNGGALLNGRPIRVSGTGKLEDALLATGFPYDVRTSPVNNLDHFVNFIRRARAIRRAGSAAIDLCYLAAGRFDGFWELKLNPWDCAAGFLMVREAGGRVTDFFGNTGSIYKPECLASNSLLHGAMLEVLRHPGDGAPS